MKVALIADTHFGVRNDAPQFLDMTKRFVDEVMVPELMKRDVKQVVHLGDLLDRRKYVAFTTANRLYRDFITPVCQVVDRFDMILGNHDVVFRNTNYPSGVSELYRHFEPRIFRTYMNPAEVNLLDDTRVLYLPWINDMNREESLRFINDTRAQICFGHLELKGFELLRGHVATEGMDPALFSKFDVTCSGHFHHKQSRDGIHYLGSHGEFTWADYDDPRGFHVFDTETRELEFIINPFTMFQKVHYDDSLPDRVDVAGKHVKVIVHNRKNQILFEQFISNLEACNPIDVQVVDDHLNAGDALEEMAEIDESEDTLSIVRKALTTAEGEFDSDRLDGLITSLYNEALTLE
jgi:predicted phosphodiesterase